MLFSFQQNNFDPDTTSAILKARKSDLKPPKFYHGDKWWQRQKGAKFYLRRKQPMEKEPKRYSQ